MLPGSSLPRLRLPVALQVQHVHLAAEPHELRHGVVLAVADARAVVAVRLHVLHASCSRSGCDVTSIPPEKDSVVRSRPKPGTMPSWSSARRRSGRSGARCPRPPRALVVSVLPDVEELVDVVRARHPGERLAHAVRRWGCCTAGSSAPASSGGPQLSSCPSFDAVVVAVKERELAGKPWPNAFW